MKANAQAQPDLQDKVKAILAQTEKDIADLLGINSPPEHKAFEIFEFVKPVPKPKKAPPAKITIPVELDVSVVEYFNTEGSQHHKKVSERINRACKIYIKLKKQNAIE